MSSTRKATATALPRKRPGAAMAVILRGSPKGHDWGWYSREDPRMHLQAVDEQHAALGYKVWLEQKGKRIVQPAGPIPAKVLKKLEAEVADNRALIEDRWTRFMIRQRWLTPALNGSVISLTAYPSFPGSKFKRTVDLADELPGIYDPASQVWPKKPVRPEEVVLSIDMNAIEIWPQKHESDRHHIYLPPILWLD